MNSKHTSTTTTITDDEVAVIEAELDAALRGKTFDNAHTIRLREIIEELCKESLSYSDDFSDLSCYSSFTKVDRLECLADEEDNTLLSEDILTLQSHSNSPGLGFLTAFCSQENSCSQDVKIKHPLSYMENASQSVVSRFSARQENTTAPFHMEIETQHETQGKDTNQIIPDKKEEFKDQDMKKIVSGTRKNSKENSALAQTKTPNKKAQRVQRGRSYKICYGELSKEDYAKLCSSDAVYSRLAAQIRYGYTEQGRVRFIVQWISEVESHVVEEAIDIAQSGFLQSAGRIVNNLLNSGNYPYNEENYGFTADGRKKIVKSQIQIQLRETTNEKHKDKMMENAKC